MKNLYLLPTDKPRTYKGGRVSTFTAVSSMMPTESVYNIYITNSEEIKEGDWCIDDRNALNKIINVSDNGYLMFENGNSVKNTKCKKIILTTDVDLIKDGVQGINDEFLEWFVKNQSCEKVDVKYKYWKEINDIAKYTYKIIIPSEVFVNSKVFSENGNELFFDKEGNLIKEESKQLFTDYPITELGDNEFKEVPIRQCELLSYDDNKYCYVKVEGIEKEIKRCYIYPQKGRCGEVDCVSIEEIKELLREKPKQELERGITITHVNKQETLEEAIERLYGAGYEALTKDQRMMRFCRLEGFMDGSDWQKERKRNIVITHIGSKETLEEAISKFFDNKKHPTSLEIAEFGAKWQSKRSQQIVPFDAYNIEVFAIKPDEQGKLFAYIGYNITNGNFHFNVVPFTEPKQEKEKYSEEDMDNYAEYCTTHVLTSQTGHPYLPVKEWFEKIKNK